MYSWDPELWYLLTSLQLFDYKGPQNDHRWLQMVPNERFWCPLLDFASKKIFPVPKHSTATADNIWPNSTQNGFLAVAWREVQWQMFFLTDSNLFYITLTRKKGFSFGTFGLGQKYQGRTVCFNLHALCQNNPDLPRKNWGWNDDADSITLWYNKWF